MSNELVVINNSAAIADEAFGVDFGELQKLVPMTISLDQPMTEASNCQPGKLRIVETGQLRDEVKIVLLEKTRESRKKSIGKFPDLKTICFSYDMIAPSKQSVDPQALACAGCKHADWSIYNETKNEELKPSCLITEKFLAVDYDLLYPVQMYVRGKSRTEGLKEGMQLIIQNLHQVKMQRGKAAWTDVIFTLKTKKLKGNPNYKIVITDVHPVTPEERAKLAETILTIGKQKAAFMQKVAEAEAAAESHAADDNLSKDVAEIIAQNPATTGPIEGEYVGNVTEI